MMLPQRYTVFTKIPSKVKLARIKISFTHPFQNDGNKNGSSHSSTQSNTLPKLCTKFLFLTSFKIIPTKQQEEIKTLRLHHHENTAISNSASEYKGGKHGCGGREGKMTNAPTNSK